MAKSSYAYMVKHEPNGSKNDITVEGTIKSIKKKRPAYGYRRVTGELHNLGLSLNV